MRENMSLLQESIDKRRTFPDYRDEIVTKIRRATSGGSMSPKSQIETEKRIRREIANSNERRRMQSINTGFETLRSLLPPPKEGEKLSKATILQMAAKYIQNLHAEVTSLKNQAQQVRQVLPSHVNYGHLLEGSDNPTPSRKRKADDSRNGFTEGFNSRNNTQEEMDDERLLSHHSVVEEFLPVSKDAARQYELLQFTACMPKQDYEQYAIEPNLPPTSASQLVIQPQAPSMVSASPRPESTSSVVGQSRSNCLEHLVMAIEQIEGSKALTSKENEHTFLMTESSYIPEPMRVAGSAASDMQYQPVVTQSHVIKPTISPFAEQLMKAASLSSPTTVTGAATPSTAALSPAVTVSSEKSNASEEYPIVTKLLNRPIPHKYLHRPQVVVNSSH